MFEYNSKGAYNFIQVRYSTPLDLTDRTQSVIDPSDEKVVYTAAQSPLRLTIASVG